MKRYNSRLMGSAPRRKLAGMTDEQSGPMSDGNSNSFVVRSDDGRRRSQLLCRPPDTS